MAISLSALAREGRLVTGGTALTGNKTQIDIRALYRHHVTIYLTTGFDKSTTITVLGLMRQGRLKPSVGLTAPLREAESVQSLIRDNQVVGKAVLVS